MAASLKIGQRLNLLDAPMPEGWRYLRAGESPPAHAPAFIVDMLVGQRGGTLRAYSPGFTYAGQFDAHHGKWSGHLPVIVDRAAMDAWYDANPSKRIDWRKMAPPIYSGTVNGEVYRVDLRFGTLLRPGTKFQYGDVFFDGNNFEWAEGFVRNGYIVGDGGSRWAVRMPSGHWPEHIIKVALAAGSKVKPSEPKGTKKMATRKGVKSALKDHGKKSLSAAGEAALEVTALAGVKAGISTIKGAMGENWPAFLNTPEGEKLLTIAAPFVLAIAADSMAGQIPYADKASAVLGIAHQAAIKDVVRDVGHLIIPLFQTIAETGGALAAGKGPAMAIDAGRQAMEDVVVDVTEGVKEPASR